MAFVLETCSVLVHYRQNESLDNVQRYFPLRLDQVSMKEVETLILQFWFIQYFGSSVVLL